jgi:hypothetical protein
VGAGGPGFLPISPSLARLGGVGHAALYSVTLIEPIIQYQAPALQRQHNAARHADISLRSVVPFLTAAIYTVIQEYSSRFPNRIILVMGSNTALYGRFVTKGQKCCSCTCMYIVPSESIRAKPPDEGPFVPARHWAKSKIAPHGQTMWARAAHLSPESGYFRSAWFSLGNDFRPQIFPRWALQGKIPVFHLVLLELFWP